MSSSDTGGSTTGMLQSSSVACYAKNSQQASIQADFLHSVEISFSEYYECLSVAVHLSYFLLLRLLRQLLPGFEGYLIALPLLLSMFFWLHYSVFEPFYFILFLYYLLILYYIILYYIIAYYSILYYSII